MGTTYEFTNGTFYINGIPMGGILNLNQYNYPKVEKIIYNLKTK